MRLRSASGELWLASAGGPKTPTLCPQDSGGIDSFLLRTKDGVVSAFDAGGLYYGGDGHWRLIPNGASDIQASSYATRISSNMSWIRSVLSSSASTTTPTASPSSAAYVPEPSSLAMLAIAAAGFLRRRRF